MVGYRQVMHAVLGGHQTDVRTAPAHHFGSPALQVLEPAQCRQCSAERFKQQALRPEQNEAG